MAARLELVELPDRDRYAGLLSHFPGWSLFHTPEWIRFLDREQAGRTRLLCIHSGSEIVGLLPGRERRVGPVRIFASPFPGWTTPQMGPLLLPEVGLDRFFAALELFLDKEGIAHCELVSQDARMGTRSGWSTSPVASYVAPLSHDPEALLAGYSKSCRKTIRQSERRGVVVSFTDDDSFKDIYCQQLREVFAKHRMVPTYGMARVAALWEESRPAGRLLTSWAMVGDRVIATRIDMLGNGTLHSFGSASDQSMLALGPNEILRHHVMAWAGGQGFTKYDLCGGGDYKRKFNASLKTSVRLIRSTPWLRAGRQLIRQLVGVRNALGYLRSERRPAAGVADEDDVG